MSSPSLSDSPGTKVDCNVAGGILDNRPKFKILKKFFNLLSQETALDGLYTIPLGFGQGPQM